MPVLNKEDGFTLLEVLAGLVLIGLIATSFITFFTSSAFSTAAAGNMTSGLYEAQDKLEEATNDGTETGAAIEITHGSYTTITIRGKEVEADIPGTNKKALIFIPSK